MRRPIVVLVALFLALILPSLRAQDFSSISGIVTDSRGAVIPGVNVTLVNPATGNTYTAVTSAFGGDGIGGAILTSPYASAVNAQVRNYPIPVIRDDFSWLKGTHSLLYANCLQLVTKPPDFVTCRSAIVTFRCKPSRLEG